MNPESVCFDLGGKRWLALLMPDEDKPRVFPMGKSREEFDNEREAIDAILRKL
jgi:hypothetical protein